MHCPDFQIAMTFTLSNSFIITKSHFQLLFYCLNSLMCCSFSFLSVFNVSMLLPGLDHVYRHSPSSTNYLSRNHHPTATDTAINITPPFITLCQDPPPPPHPLSNYGNVILHLGHTTSRNKCHHLVDIHNHHYTSPTSFKKKFFYSFLLLLS